MTCEEINPNDVLCGRGGLTNSHVGNKRFRIVVAEYQLEYLKARKNDKKDIARTVVSRIRESGGRFLQRNSNSNLWSAASAKRAVEKTSQALREGLDVRHKSVRPRKMIRDQNMTRMNSSAKNQENLAKGIVIDDSPKVREYFEENVPELVHELTSQSFDPIFTFFPSTTVNATGNVTEEECGMVLSI